MDSICFSVYLDIDKAAKTIPISKNPNMILARMWLYLMGSKKEPETMLEIKVIRTIDKARSNINLTVLRFALGMKGNGETKYLSKNKTIVIVDNDM